MFREIFNNFGRIGFAACSQSFNSVNTFRILGRWMQMFTNTNQSSIAKVFAEFDDAGRMKPSAYYDRIIDVMEANRRPSARASVAGTNA